MVVSGVSRALLVIHFIACICSAAEPYMIKWSSRTYGPDGPWHAINVSIGSPPQEVDLLMFHRGSSTPIATFDGCKNPSGAGCAWAQSGTYDCFGSKTADIYKGSGASFWNKTQQIYNYPGVTTLQGTAVWCRDTIDIPAVPADLSVKKVGFQTIVKGFYNLSQGINYPDVIGGLSTGDADISAPLGSSRDIDLPGAPDETAIHQDLYKREFIPSPSWTMNIGSVLQKIPPTLVYGGYYPSKILGPVLAQNLDSGSLLRVDVTNIALYNYSYSESKPIPFAPGSDSGLLRLSSDRPIGLLGVDIDFNLPWLVLPRSTCDSIAQYLPVERDQVSNAYVWLTDDPRYRELMRGMTYLNFTVQSDTRPITTIPINIPLQLLSLTLEAPIVDKPKKIFPCRSGFDNGSAFGRAFFQAVTIGFNWRDHRYKNDPDFLGTWFIAQAPGPTFKYYSSVPILPGQKNFKGSNDAWADTWKGHWGFSEPDTPQDGALSTGAQAGIAVVSTVIGLIILLSVAFFLRHRRQKVRGQGQATTGDHEDGPSSKRVYPKAELDLTEAKLRAELSSNEINIHEIGEASIYEVEDQEIRGELPASNIIGELDGKPIENIDEKKLLQSREEIRAAEQAKDRSPAATEYSDSTAQDS